MVNLNSRSFKFNLEYSQKINMLYNANISQFWKNLLDYQQILSLLRECYVFNFP